MFRTAVAARGIDVISGEGTCFVYCRCPDGRDDEEFVHDLAARGVLALPSTIFHEPGHFRLALNVCGDRAGDIARRIAPHPSDADS